MLPEGCLVALLVILEQGFVQKTTRYEAAAGDTATTEDCHAGERTSSRVAHRPANAAERRDEMDRTPPSALDDANSVGRRSS